MITFFLQPILLYGISGLSQANKSLFYKLLILQNGALRIIFRLKAIESVIPLFFETSTSPSDIGTLRLFGTTDVWSMLLALLFLKTWINVLFVPKIFILMELGLLRKLIKILQIECTEGVFLSSGFLRLWNQIPASFRSFFKIFQKGSSAMFIWLSKK